MWTTFFLFAAVASVQGGYIPYSDVSSYDQAVANKAEEAHAVKKVEEEATAAEKPTEEDAAAKKANEEPALAKKTEEEASAANLKFEEVAVAKISEEEAGTANKPDKASKFDKRQKHFENEALKATKEKGRHESEKSEGNNNPRIYK